jgi:Zn-dependent M28 family amino/carboxypeptidase
MQKFSTFYIIASFLLFLLYSCSDDQNTSAASVTVSKSPVTIPKFNRDSSYNFVAQQVAFGPRVPGSEAHKLCANYLKNQLETFGAEVTLQNFSATAFDGTTLDGTNIIGSFNPKHPKRLILAAHWDTRPFSDSPVNTSNSNEPNLGADDGASGVGIWLEVARMLKDNPIDLGIDIIFFDLEDYGENSNENSWGLGSQYWSSNFHVKNYQAEAGILLDMVGAKNAVFPKEQFSAYFAPELLNRIWKLAQRMGYGNYFSNNNGGAITDDHYFVNTIAKIPMIDVIHRPINSNTGFPAHWHTPDDNLDIIDTKTLGAVGQVMVAAIYRFGQGNL